MNPMELKTLAFLVAATLSCGAFAQSSSGQAGATPPSSATPTTAPPATNPSNAPNPTPNPPPMNSPTSPQTQANPSLPQSPSQTATPGTAGTSTTMGGNSQQVFASLDRTHKGYLNQQDVASNSFLSGNFQK